MAKYYIYETSRVTHFFQFEAPEGLSDAEVLEKWDTYCAENDKFDCYVDEDWSDVESYEVERPAE